MGYKLRRLMREALGPEITGLQRAIALEIADDANDETRESFVDLDTLARWTAAKDADVVRNALKRLAAAGWEFRVPLGTGKDGRVLYAVPGVKLTFKVPSFVGGAVATPIGGAVATPRQAEGERKGERGLLKGGAGAPSEGAPAPPISSIPSTIPSTQEPCPSPTARTKTVRETEPPREDVEAVCRHLADRIEANGSRRPTITQRWRDAARLLIDKDGRTVEQITKAIDWCQDDSFWKANILSMPKLRDKYDQLRLRAQEQNRSQHTPYQNPVGDNPYDFRNL